MRALIQRVSTARVCVGEKVLGKINRGLVILIGIRNGDTQAEIEYIAEKAINLRIFEDEQGKMNLSALNTAAEILAISQFTLYADCRRGRRPGFSQAAPPETSKPLYEDFVRYLKKSGLKIAEGEFGAHMLVEIHNDGPVTIMLDSDEK